MNKIEELIEKLCPNGVEYKSLKECTEMKRGTSATKNKLTYGDIPVISGGKEPSFYCDTYNRIGETITVAGSGAGAGYVQYWKTPIFVNDAFSIKAIEKLDTRYVYHYLLNIQDEIYATKKGGGVPHVHVSSIENFKIPIPPLRVQREIVRILDTFSEYTTELTKELTMRKKQYEYYRDSLLSFGDEVEWKTLEEISKISRGIRVVKKELSINGKYAVYQNSMIPLGYYDKSNCKANTTFIISAGAAGKIGYSYEDFWAADDCFYFDSSKNLNNRYLYFYLNSQNEYIYSRVRKASIPRLSRTVVEKIKIPLPPLEEQQRIVDILDRFDTLCNDISKGLPGEIEVRQKQYEYYRGKLLKFKNIND